VVEVLWSFTRGVFYFMGVVGTISCAIAALSVESVELSGDARCILHTTNLGNAIITWILADLSRSGKDSVIKDLLFGVFLVCVVHASHEAFFTRILIHRLWDKYDEAQAKTDKTDKTE